MQRKIISNTIICFCVVSKLTIFAMEDQGKKWDATRCSDEVKLINTRTDDLKAVPDIIFKKIGINLTDVFIMGHLQKKHQRLLFLLPSKITSGNDFSRWVNVSAEMIEDCKSLLNNFKPKYIVINLSKSKHRNLLIINVEEEILTYFEPNTLSFDLLDHFDYLEQEQNYHIFSMSILTEFRVIFNNLKLGLIWRNISWAMSASFFKLDIPILRQSRIKGWCTLDCYAFLDTFMNKTIKHEDALFNAACSILKELCLSPNLLNIYEENQISMNEIKQLLPQVDNSSH